MSFRVGTKVGPYEIVDPIGAGGMGEVYRAHDSKLGRDVAIKVLPDEFTDHPEKLARFEREAKLLATLNHPKIATLYGVDEVETQPFLVMELVEGETLAERIARGPIAVAEALAIAHQVAEALEAAHERGVIHRDLKPANIKVDAEGNVKVLDFGLAKALADDAPESEPSQSPTLSRDATRAGVILGTAAYMSPEQAKGKAVDKRTDIFSFGIVLYEMLTGTKAFAGEDVPEVLAAIINQEPDWKARPAGLDPRIPKLVDRCLRKDRRKRLRDIGDARNEIEEIASAPAGVSASASVAPAARGISRPLTVGMIGVAIGGLVAGAVVWNSRPVRESGAPMRFAITLPADQSPSGRGDRVVALSPDGSRLAYTANGQLFLREMGEMGTVPIRGTDVNPWGPFFSPDGQWIGFFALADNTLKKVSIRGGTPMTLCEVQSFDGGSWGRDDSIVFGQGSSILRVSANGGSPEILAELDRTKAGTVYGPQILPDGETLLFSLRRGGSWDEAQIVVQSIASGEQRILIEGGADARYVPTGHVVYARGETLLAVPFDHHRLEVTGGAVPVIENVERSPAGFATAPARYSFSDTGSLVFMPNSNPAGQLLLVDRDGLEVPLPAPLGQYSFPRLSPNGEQLAVIEGGDVWIYSVARGTSTRLTFTEDNNYLAWTPDGKRVVFSSARSGAVNLFWKSVDGSDDAVQLTTGEAEQHVDSISPDGRTVSFHEHVGPSTDLWVLPLEDEGEPRPYLQTPFNERASSFSPDGRWLAYVSDESGRHEVYAQPFPGPGGKSKISTNGGRSPLWHQNGRELFYRGADSEMMVVEITTTERGLEVGTPRLLFQKSRDRSGPLRHYDVTPDGERFVIVLPDEASTPTRLNVVLNWFGELKRLVPME